MWKAYKAAKPNVQPLLSLDIALDHDESLDHVTRQLSSETRTTFGTYRTSVPKMHLNTHTHSATGAITLSPIAIDSGQSTNEPDT